MQVLDFLSFLFLILMVAGIMFYGSSKIPMENKDKDVK